MLDRYHNFVDTLPLVGVLGLPVNHLKAFKNVNNVIDSTSFNRKFSSALIKVKHSAGLAPIEA